MTELAAGTPTGDTTDTAASAAAVAEQVERAITQRRRELFLQGRHLAALPEALARGAPTVSRVYAQHNALTAFPAALLALPLLSVLDLSHNQLRELPTGLGKQLKQLRVLLLANNELAALPTDLGEATAVRVLDVSHNKLAALPDQVALLAQLEVLRLEGNPLAVVPPAAAKLAKLRRLGCAGMDLSPDAAKVYSKRGFRLKAAPKGGAKKK